MDPITRQAVAKSVLHRPQGAQRDVPDRIHDMDFVLDCCDRVALMKGGKMVALGTPRR